MTTKELTDKLQALRIEAAANRFYTAVIILKEAEEKIIDYYEICQECTTLEPMFIGLNGFFTAGDGSVVSPNR